MQQAKKATATSSDSEELDEVHDNLSPTKNQD